MSSLLNPGPVSNPVGVETKSLIQLIVGDNVIGDERPCSQNLNPRQRIRPLAGQDMVTLWILAFGHGGLNLRGSPDSPSSHVAGM